MAPILFALVSLLCLVHTLAVPLVPRTAAPLDCRTANVDAIEGIESARTALGPINTNNDIGSAQNLLEAQLSLLQANNGTTNIAVALELQNAQPAIADQQNIVNGLLAAQATLNKTFSFDNSTEAAVKTANDAITPALVTAQQALATPCTL